VSLGASWGVGKGVTFVSIGARGGQRCEVVVVAEAVESSWNRHFASLFLEDWEELSCCEARS
jgi:hypothetical protein